MGSEMSLEYQCKQAATSPVVLLQVSRHHPRALMWLATLLSLQGLALLLPLLTPLATAAAMVSGSPMRSTSACHGRKGISGLRRLMGNQVNI
jgi:hypothetical protein